MTNILLFCSQPILEAGVRSMMGGDLANFELTDSCFAADTFIEQVKTLRPALALIDVTAAATLDFLRAVMDASRTTGIVLWGDGASPEFLSQAIAMGVRGILRKGQSVSAHAECLRSVANGQVWLDQELAGRLLSRTQVHLTPRERQLIGLVAQGLKNKEIAYSLGITEGTVKVYLSRLFPKVGANDRFDLALMGLRNIEVNSRHAFDRVTAKSSDRAVPLAIPASLSTERLPKAA